jgi:hypothetical protein
MHTLQLEGRERGEIEFISEDIIIGYVRITNGRNASLSFVVELSPAGPGIAAATRPWFQTS